MSGVFSILGLTSVCLFFMRRIRHVNKAEREMLHGQKSVCGAFEKVDVYCKCLQGFPGYTGNIKEKGL